MPSYRTYSSGESEVKNNSFEAVAMWASVTSGCRDGWPVGAARLGSDIRAYVADTINGGRIHIFEPGLEAAYRKMSQVRNHYGDGRAAQRIAEIVSQSR
jgi:hypothetical protein